MSYPTTLIFGRYVAKSSIVHALDARCKLTLLLVFIAANVITTTPGAMILCAAFVFVAYCLAHIPARTAFICVAPLSILVIFTALANLFFVQGGAVLWSVSVLSITENGFHQAIFMSARLMILLFGACLVTMTTTALDITDAFESMLSPFARFGLPAHELAMIGGIALRFLPQFATEFSNIRNAQISSVFRHADALAAGMDARCYHGGVGRTHLHEQAFHARDALACAITLLLLAGSIACKVMGI